MRHKKERKAAAADKRLQGWAAIASYLAIPVSTAHRWAKDGMPVHRDGRFTVADSEELRAWLGREAHMSAAAQILTDKSDVAEALKASIAETKRSQKNR